jgi:hypothetical protein
LIKNIYTQKFEPNFPLKHIFPRKLKNIKNKTITVETPHQIKHNTAQEQQQINKITTCNLKKKKTQQQPKSRSTDVHHRYPKPNNLQIANPSRRSLLQPKQTMMRGRGRGEAHLVAMRERSGLPGSAVASGWHRWLRRYLTVAFTLSTVCSATRRTSAE